MSRLVHSITAIIIIFSFLISFTADRLVNVENTDMVNDCSRSRKDDQLVPLRLVLIKRQKSKASIHPLIVGLSLVLHLTELMGF